LKNEIRSENGWTVGGTQGFANWITYLLDITAQLKSKGDYLLWFVKGKEHERRT